MFDFCLVEELCVSLFVDLVFVRGFVFALILVLGGVLMRDTVKELRSNE
jgi:hypothetical protein